VSLVGRLYQRFRHLIHEFAKFGVIGGIGFLVTEGVFNLMISEHQATFTANAVATLVAAAVTFVGNRYWTFRHRMRSGMGQETAIFIVLNLIGILIQQACLELAKHELGRHDKITLNAAFLVGVALATMFRFWSYRKWVWRHAQPAAAAVAYDGRRSPPSHLTPGGREEREPELVPPAPAHRPAQRPVGPQQARNGRRSPPRHARLG
jgi:putative flippase GtrA